MYRVNLIAVTTLVEKQHLSEQTSRLYSDRLRVERPGLDSRQSNIFLFSTASGPTLGPTQTHIKWVQGAILLEVKQVGREADHSPPSSAEVKNGGAIPPLPICLYGIVFN
jgi:hypothetical protein